MLDETIDADIAAIELEFQELAPVPQTATEAGKPRRVRLPRVEITHEP